MKKIGTTIFIVTILSLISWYFFYINDMTLDSQETTIITGFWFVVIFLGRIVWTRIMRKSKSSTIIVLLVMYSVFSLPLRAYSNENSEPTGKGNPDSLNLICSMDKPVVTLNDSVDLRAWVITPASENTLNYLWTATAGSIYNQQSQTKWNLSGVKPGKYNAYVRIESKRGSAECSVQVLIEEPLKKEDLRGNSSKRITAWSFLENNKKEEIGYGLYSYLLFASPPADNISRDRYLKVIEAYLRYIQHIKKLEKYFVHNNLNVTYLPITTVATKNVTSQWVLEHYDYARAQLLLRGFKENLLEGPYLVSSLKPLGSNELSTNHIKQDLTQIPPNLASAWVREFLNQAAQERFWDEKTINKMKLNIRNTISILARGLPEVQKSINSLIPIANEMGATQD